MILALDFGTRTGVAYGGPDARPTLETWIMPAGGGEDVGEFAGVFADKLDELLSEHAFDCLTFEAPFVAIRYRDPVRKQGPYLQLPQIRRAYGMAAIVESVAHRHGIDCFEVVTVTLKKDFTGSGRSKKPDMMCMAELIGFAPKNDNEADALACWLYELRRRHPYAAHRYDQIFARQQVEARA